MDAIIIAAIAKGGYLGIFLLMVLENVVPPVPSEVIMGLGGVLVERGRMDFWLLLLIGTTGATAGNLFWFWLGRRWGYVGMRPFVERHGRWLTIEWADIERAAVFFRKHGQWVVFVMRFSPFMRTLISLPAGMTGMGLGRFVLFTFTGTLIWNAGLIMAGGALARHLGESQHWLGIATLTAIGLGLVWYVRRVWIWRPRADR
ncbi:Alkaline phosphatase [Alteripontixanthobacter maritimus]|uniref:Alkaline phosphatase n=1 Tax=Alteripontixanthobacter maritimus TaxID=2161824 RepID=A0A369QAI1_9SPHN|nr:DedA family protein [Alteripontixanthobacter maritimus]RDC59929.1 Alkaline phosphatase [Alteripontixanthobacter maritimus]